jgi:phage terminase small subunit
VTHEKLVQQELLSLREIDLKLSPRQEVFCRNIVSGDSATVAYKKAYGPPVASKKTICEAACRLHKKVEIRARIEQLNSRAVASTVMSRLEILQKLTEIGRNDRSSDHDRTEAMKLIGKYNGLWVDGVSQINNNNNVVNDNRRVIVKTLSSEEELGLRERLNKELSEGMVVSGG